MTLTDSGHALLDAKRERWRRFIEEALVGFSEAELAAAAKAFGALAEGIAGLE